MTVTVELYWYLITRHEVHEVIVILYVLNKIVLSVMKFIVEQGHQKNK